MKMHVDTVCIFMTRSHDFRVISRPLEVTTSPSCPSAPPFPSSGSTRDNIKGMVVFGQVAIVGLTVYHLYMISRWRSDCYASRKESKGMHIGREVTEDYLILKEGADFENSGEQRHSKTIEQLL